MARALLGRALSAAAVLLTVSLLIFAACEVLPGDAAQIMLGEDATPQEVAQLRGRLGLDRPPAERYVAWIGGLAAGEFGTSFTTKRAIAEILPARLENTALLTLLTTLVAVPAGLALGIAMALWAGGGFDRALSVGLLALAATPEFLIGTAGVLVFAVNLRWLPSISSLNTSAGLTQIVTSLILPVLTLASVLVAQIARMTRAALVGLADRPFVEMATLKGASRLRVVLVHTLVNAAGPLANIVTINVAYLVSGVVIVETIFAVPGLAQLMINSVSTRDMPVIEACAMIFCAAYVLLMLLADLLSLAFNPRLRRTVR